MSAVGPLDSDSERGADPVTESRSETTTEKSPQEIPALMKSASDLGSSRPEMVAISSKGRALTRDEVMELAMQPFWVRLRLALEIMFWCVFAALIVGILTLSVQHPKCEEQPSLEWWQESVFYKIYVRSFKDSDADGVGDIQGVHEQLDYISSLNVGGIVLSGVVKSSSDGLLSDTTDFTDVSLGSLTQLRALINDAHNKGIKVILEVVPNQSGTQHPWFVESSQPPPNDYSQYYVWDDQPSNWLSVYNGSAWSGASGMPARSDHYLHQFSTSEPELNLRNDRVVDHISDALRFWVDQGIDGFELSNVDFLFEDYELRNESQSAAPPLSDWYESLNHTYTRGLDHSRLMVSQWRAEVMARATLNQSISVMIANPGQGTNTHGQAHFYGRYGSKISDLVSSHQLLGLQDTTTGNDVADLVNEWRQALGDESWPTWSLSNYWSSRVGSRLSEPHVKLSLTLSLLLPGTPVITYGDELGVQDIQTPPSLTAPQDLPYWLSRGAMPWTSTGNFSTSTPWIDYPQQYQTYNVETQESSSTSVLALFKLLVTLRKEPSFAFGHFRQSVINSNIYSFIRHFDGHDSYLVTMNWGTTTSNGESYMSTWSEAAEKVTIAATSGTSYEPDEEIKLNDIKLASGEALVVKWPYRVRPPHEY